MKKLLYIYLLLCLAISASAVPAKRGPRNITQPDGTTITAWLHGDEFYNYFTDAEGRILERDGNGFYVAGDRQTDENIRAKRAASPMKKARKVGTPNLNASRGLFILVNFTDSTYRSTDTRAQMDSMLNQHGYNYDGSPGSARDYFIEQSGGRFAPHFDVYGPVTLSHPESYYGANYSGTNTDKLGYQMIIDACNAIDSQVDFSIYDTDNDGYIDFVYVIYAGMGANDGGKETDIWPHQWGVYTGARIIRRYDGKVLDNYACGAEVNGLNRRNGIGVLAHEFSHVLGLPDYYDVNYQDNYDNGITPNEWSLMDYGPYNNDGICPPNYSAHDKYFLGWSTPTLLDTAENVTLPADNNTFRYITSDGSTTAATSEKRVYYIENRQNTGWDEYLPGHGLVVWDVNYKASLWSANTVNSTTNVTRFTVVSASGDKNYIGLCSTAGFEDLCNHDPFPGTTGTTAFYPFITGNQQPADCAYPMTDITEANGVITFKMAGGISTNPTEASSPSEERCSARKVLISGTLRIERQGNTYDALGRRLTN